MEESDPMEKARYLTVMVLVDIKNAYLRTGVNALKHIEQIQTRLLAAAKTCSGVEELFSQVSRKLNLGGPSSKLSSSVISLCDHVNCTLGAAAWLDMVERETAYLIVRMRGEAEQAPVQKAEL